MRILFLVFLLALLSCNQGTQDESSIPLVVKNDQQLRDISKAVIAPTLDGRADDPAWEGLPWYPLDQNWLGGDYTAADFEGQFKLTWTPDALYLLAEIKDDSLVDQYANPLTLWWDDDCLEIFIDADNSGGEHQFNHNAFAYHVALDGNVVDLAPGEIPTLYNSHVTSSIETKGNTSVWECAIQVFGDDYQEHKATEALILEKGQKIGFALAYCDNDGSAERENFIGSIPVEGADKNRGWIDAGIFGTLNLTD